MARGCEVLVLLCLAGVLALSCGNSTFGGTSVTIQGVVKEARRNCFGRSSKECVYLDFFTLLDQVLPSSVFQGLRGNTSVPALPIRVSNSDKHRSGVSVQMVNHLLADRLYRQLSAASVLGAKALGNTTFQTLRRVMDLQPTDNQQVQRGRRFTWWKYLSSLLLTLALTIFSALISKALTLATISLLLSLLGLLGGLGGSVGGGNEHKYSYPYPPPQPAYRSPATFITAARHPGLQYEDEQEDPANPYVYVNRKHWKSARSGGSDRFYKYQPEVNKRK